MLCIPIKRVFLFSLEISVGWRLTPRSRVLKKKKRGCDAHVCCVLCSISRPACKNFNGEEKSMRPHIGGAAKSWGGRYLDVAGEDPPFRLALPLFSLEESRSPQFALVLVLMSLITAPVTHPAHRITPSWSRLSGLCGRLRRSDHISGTASIRATSVPSRTPRN